MDDRRRVGGLSWTSSTPTSAYADAARTSEAIAIYEPLVADQRRVLGSEHRGSLSTRNNLAGAYQAAARTCDARGVGQRRLAAD